MAVKRWPTQTTQLPDPASFYTYGQGPEFDFFNTIPTEPEPEPGVAAGIAPVPGGTPRPAPIPVDDGGRERYVNPNRTKGTGDVGEDFSTFAGGVGDAFTGLYDSPVGFLMPGGGIRTAWNALTGGDKEAESPEYGRAYSEAELHAMDKAEQNGAWGTQNVPGPTFGDIVSRQMGGQKVGYAGARGGSALSPVSRPTGGWSVWGDAAKGSNKPGRSPVKESLGALGGTGGSYGSSGKYTSGTGGKGTRTGGVGLDQYGREIGAHGQFTRDVTGRGDGSASAGNTRVICTELKRQGIISKDDWKRDLKFTASHLSDIHVRGYHLFAIPVVRALRKGRWVKTWTWIAQHRANDIAYVTGDSEKSDWAGRAIRCIMEPACWALGRFMPEQDWASLYEGEHAQ